MSALPAGVRARMLLRSLAVQGSWNYRTLIGTGLAFVLAPALERICRGDPDRLRHALGRHAELFNAHPYLATVAAGAVARLEADGAPPEVVERFKSAVRGSLGTLGDRLVWLTWRPMAVLLGLALVLAGAAWWVAAGAFLLVYNALHLWMRAWGLRVGLRDGLAIAKTLREAPFESMAHRAADAGAVLAGAAAVLAATAGPDAARWEYAAGAAAMAAGVALGRHVRAAAAIGMLLVLFAGLLLARG